MPESRKSTTKRSSAPSDKSPKPQGRSPKQEKGKGKGKGKQRPAVQLDFDLEPARPENPQRAAKEIETLEKIDATSSERAAEQVVDILSPAASGQETDVVRACCLALLRLMQDPKGLLAVVNARAIECLYAITESIVIEEDGQAVFRQEAHVVREEASKKAGEYIETVDHIDFHELPTVLLLVAKLHRESEIVCFKGFATLMRFASYDPTHGQEMLNKGMITVLGFVVKTYKEPELLRRSLFFLSRLSAAPFGSEAATLILQDDGLLPAVITTLEERPTDIALQLNGFRLLTAWSRASIELRQEVLSSGAPSLLQTRHKLLRDAGLDHISSWLWAIAGRSLIEDVSTVSEELAEGRQGSKTNRKSPVSNRKSNVK